MSVFRKHNRSLVSLAVAAVLALALCQYDAHAQEMEAAEEAVAIFNQAQDLHEKGDLAGALKLYDRSLEILPEFPEAAYQRGSAQLALGKVADAESSFRRAVELRPDWSLAFSGLGAVLVQQEKFTEAEPVLTKALALDDLNFPAFAAMTELRIKTKASTATIEMLLGRITDLTAKANPPVSIWINRSALENHLGQKAAARSSINRALAIDPNNKNALIQSAEIAFAVADTKRAAADAALLEKLSPGSETAKLIRAEILYIEADNSGALKMLDLIAAAKAAPLRKRITATAATNAAELEKQLAANEKDAAILGQLCRLYRRNEPEKAISYCRRASEAEPKNINHAVGFGAALVQAKQFDAAVVTLRKLLAAAPDNATARANLATALFQLKRFPEAKSEFLWLTNAQPKSAAAYYHLALTHDHLKEYVDAIANYQQFLRLATDAENKLEIEKVNLRLPDLQKLIKKK